MLTEMINWLFIRPWHFWVPVLIFSFLLISGWWIWSNQSLFILKIGSFAMQAVGVAILIFILNQNIITINNTSIIADARKWLVENPFNKRSQSVEITGSGGIAAGGTAKARGKKIGNTIEEKIMILEEEIESIRKEADENKNALNMKIAANKREADEKYNNIKSCVSKIETKLEGTVIGDYKVQLFGTWMILLGLFLSVLPAKIR